MPWKENTKMSLKTEFVSLALGAGANVRELCRRFEISPTTGYELIRRFQQEGTRGLEDRSRRPRGSPRKTSEEVEELVLSWRDLCGWGGRKIHHAMLQAGLEPVPAPSTITNILRRHGRLTQQASASSPPYKRYERKEPNSLWQMDFKGDFSTHKGRCYPLTALDDHSRFNLILKACANQMGPPVQEHLIETFERYGLPDQILCDHGQPWAVSAKPHRGQFYSTLEVWLMDVGVEVIHGRPAHPQTQGKEERFHRTLKQEVLQRTLGWKNLLHCQKAFDDWRYLYNELRPHESLDNQVPLSAYTPSLRKYHAVVEVSESEYLQEDILRKVKSKGEVTFNNKFYYIGRAFKGKWVAFRPRKDDLWDVYYRWKCLGQIDEKAGRHIKKSKYQPLTRPTTAQEWGVEEVP